LQLEIFLKSRVYCTTNMAKQEFQIQTLSCS
jgi:hypothetical protein